MTRVVHFSSALVASLLLATVGSAFAGQVPQQRGSACSAVWDFGAATTNPGRKPPQPWTVDCIDGDPSCDLDGAANGSCSIGVNVCLFQGTIAGCTPEAVTDLKILGAARKRVTGLVTPAVNATAPTCGTAGVVTRTLRRRGKKPSAPVLLKFKTTAASGRGMSRVRVRCMPVPDVPVSFQCPDREAPGLPKEARFDVTPFGSDLDNGVSGSSHNFPIPLGASLRFCLSGCDASTNPVCTGEGSTGDGSVNGPTFGSPLPLSAANVPVCVVNRFNGNITGTIDLVNGGVSNAEVALASDVVLTPPTEVCPRCNAGGGGLGSQGTCSQTARNPGRRCTVNGEATVNGDRYTLSSDCLPGGTPAGTLDIRLPLTTADSTLQPTTPRPCPGQTADDACGTGTCSATCTGNACVEVRDGECVDVKGGISQLCCSSDTTTPCFPTRTGALTRTGSPFALQPAWPDPTYPKTATNTELVATFCEAATASSVVNIVTGLPGPGALIFNAGPVTVTAQE